MTQIYSDPSRESEPHALPDVEIFYLSREEVVQSRTITCDLWFDTDNPNGVIGWYWWACFPGCVPDSDPVGPFDTEDEAIADAQAW